MTRYLSIVELVKLYRALMESAGRRGNIPDLRMIRYSAVRPKARAGPRELFPTLPRKAVELCCSLVKNFDFVEGEGKIRFVEGKIRIAHAALETMLVLNGYEIAAPLDEQERVMLAVADDRMTEKEFTEWVDSRLARHGETGKA